MFLVVIFTLVISILGLYAQVLSLQTSKLYHMQNGLMQTMLTWHGAAYGLIKNNLPLSSAFPCELTNSSTILLNSTTESTCAKGATKLYVLSNAQDLYKAGQQSTLQFYTVAYQITGTPTLTYVLTFIDPTYADLSGNLLLPGAGGTNSGFTMQSLYQQFARAAPVGTLYGYINLSTTNLVVQSHALGIVGTGASGQQTYPIGPVASLMTPGATPFGLMSIIY